MDLNSTTDAFVRAFKKQRVSSNKTQEVIGRVGQVIEQVLAELQLSGNNDSSSNQRSLLIELRNKLNEIAPMKHIEGSLKEMSIGLVKYTKIIEKEFNQDISKACRIVNWDIHTINGIIACHFYREGLFDVGDCFVEEANVPDVAKFRSLFMNMHQILEAMRLRNLEPAISWAASEHEQLLVNGSDLELKLHRLQFLDTVQKGSRSEALTYAKKYLASFASTHKNEIQRLMGCLLWVGRLSESPYAEFTSLSQWEKLAEEVCLQFCSLFGQSSRDPLSVAVAAGFHALPTLLKMASVTAATNQNWQELKTLPTAVELPNELMFHSIFVCPVLWEQASEDNPPMMLPCGHVLCKQAIVKMAKSSTRHFKCPYCPNETTLNHCKQLHF